MKVPIIDRLKKIWAKMGLILMSESEKDIRSPYLHRSASCFV